MKAYLITVFLVAFVGLSIKAQSTEKSSNYPYHTLSKDVMKIQYRDIAHVPTKIYITNSVLTQSKGIAQLRSKRIGNEKRLVVRGGYPAWTVSKGVARRQFEKSQSR